MSIPQTEDAVKLKCCAKSVTVTLAGVFASVMFTLRQDIKLYRFNYIYASIHHRDLFPYCVGEVKVWNECNDFALHISRPKFFGIYKDNIVIAIYSYCRFLWQRHHTLCRTIDFYIPIVVVHSDLAHRLNIDVEFEFRTNKYFRICYHALLSYRCSTFALHSEQLPFSYSLRTGQSATLGGKGQR